MPSFNEENVRTHFETLAHSYDDGKTKNSTYYSHLKKCLQELIPPGKSVLEIGCGTGDILHSLSPSRATGIDIANAMIKKCKQKYPQGTWFHGNLSDFLQSNDDTYDFIVLADTVEHVPNLPVLFSQLHSVAHSGTQLVITMANPLWEPLLLALEALRLKMPEGPHKRLKSRVLQSALCKESFVLKSRTFHLLLPTSVPILSFVAAQLEKIPLLRRCAVIEILCFEYVETEKSTHERTSLHSYRRSGTSSPAYLSDP